MRLEVDHDRQRVTLHVLELDVEKVTYFLEHELGRLGVRARGGASGRGDDMPRYDLVIAFARRRHPAELRDGARGPNLWLADPDAQHLARCMRVVEEVLEAAHANGVHALVPGIDEHGRPDPVDGCLYVYVDGADDAQEEALHDLCNKLEATHQVAIAVVRFTRRYGAWEEVVAQEAHFVWDPDVRQVVHRNWATPPCDDNAPAEA